MRLPEGPLRSRNFRLLLACNVISVTGTAVAVVAIPFAVLAASEGLLPQTVPAHQRAPANAMDRVGRNGAQIGGAALGGVLVGLAGPGWQGFISRRWLWTIVAEFGFVVAVFTATTSVLGPIVAHARFGGARSWGAILAAYAVGAVLGGIVMLRFRPQRMLLAASLSVPAFSVFLFALAVPLAVPLVAAAALLAGGCLEVFGVNWATTMQQEIPAVMLSRLSSYDALGSLALAPVGTAVAGPLASAFGTPAVLTAGGILIVLLTIAVLLVPEIRQLRRQVPARSGQAGLLTQQ